MFLVGVCPSLASFFFFFFNDTATTEIYTLSLHDALPISRPRPRRKPRPWRKPRPRPRPRDRKSTRLNSSHTVISYAVFCLKKKNNQRSPAALHRDSVCPVRRLYLYARCRYVLPRGGPPGRVIFAVQREMALSRFFFNDTATTEIYTLSLHDALPISMSAANATPSQFSRLIYSTAFKPGRRSEEHTSELQSHSDLVCRLLLEKKKNKNKRSLHAYNKNKTTTYNSN